MHLLGYDIGSSSIKATLLEVETGKVIASATSPKTELEIIAPKPGWAEQHPETWWQQVKLATAAIKSQAKNRLADVRALGISYQMHGLVVVDQHQRVLRPAIIWCDSRAVDIGNRAFTEIGPEKCLARLLNSPGNFTASKLTWIKENEPGIFKEVDKMMLPGDFIAMKLTGDIKTTPSGLSEGIMWDFQDQEIANLVLDYYGISTQLVPTVVPTFSVQGELTRTAADELGLKPGVKVSYRAGDQPNNALSLNVLNPGEVAATAGTSGVVYGVGASANYDPQSRVNTFVHVNHSRETARYGVLLCINGTGILNSWLKHNSTGGHESTMTYEQMNALAAQAPVGSRGLVILPFGNGAERSLENKNIGASVHGLNFNSHDRTHLLRAGQEGIVFAFNYGIQIMRAMGIDVKTVRAGHANMFLSRLFGEAFATVTDAVVQLYNTDGSQGAARGAGIGAGIYRGEKDAFTGLKSTGEIYPIAAERAAYQEAYEKWLGILKQQI